MDRLQMPAAMPAEVAERQSDRGGDLPKWALEQAHDTLTEKLKGGESAGGCDLRDLLDSELNGERYKLLLDEMMGVLRAERGEHGAKADALIDGLVERYLSTGIGEEAVIEKAEEILSEPVDA